MQGFLLLNKPSGITSFGAVARIKRLTGEKRIGHTGTLDPMATGVLPIFIGKATALSPYLLEGNKKYIATVRLGIQTDTCDITGTVINKACFDKNSVDIVKTLQKFLGKQKQIPPIYSALKQNGIRLYELARNGKSADIPARDIEIFDISLLSPIDSNNEFSFSVTVSKGTYIRSLARDLGEELGCGATLTALERVSASGFNIDSCVDLNDLNEQNIENYIKDEASALPHLQRVNITTKQAIRFSNGGPLFLDRISAETLKDGQIIKVFCFNTFIGLGIADFNSNMLLIKCNINKPVAE